MQSNHNIVRKHAGFTLIELIIAMSVTAIITLIAYSALNSAIKINNAMEHKTKQIQRISRAISLLEKDLAHIVPRKIRTNSSSAYQPAFQYSPEQDIIISFSRNGKINDKFKKILTSNLQRVNYSYQDKKLTRTSWNVMDRYDESDNAKIVLLENVEKFSLRLIVRNLAINQSKLEYVDRWPKQDNPSSLTSLPLAIEVNIELTNFGTIRRLIEVASEK